MSAGDLPIRELQIKVTRMGRNKRFRQVRLLIDGKDSLADGGFPTGNLPEDILDNGALLPANPPRRVALYGCSCGIFGCDSLSALVVGRGDRIEWTQFVSGTGLFDSALDEECPDPVADMEGDSEYDLFVHHLDTPTISFDAEQYRSALDAATTDRSWESQELAVLRHLDALRPHTFQLAGHRDHLVAYRDLTSPVLEARVPDGEPAHVARDLLAALEIEGAPWLAPPERRSKR